MDTPTSIPGAYSQVIQSKTHFRVVLASPYPIEPQVPRWLGISALGDQTFVPQTAGSF